MATHTHPQTDDFDLLLSLRKATRRSHHVANALILSKLVVVLTDRTLYAQALSSFLPVYQKLEQLQADKSIASTPGLCTVIAAVSSIPSRSQAMQEDLTHLLGKDWQTKVPASQAAATYAEHLQHLADTDPLLLLPYVFSMHVPILLGFLGQRVQKTLQLPDERGLAFFTVPDKASRMAALRAAVTQAGRDVPASSRQQLMDEAVEQFRRNNAVVAEFRLGWRPLLRAVPVYVYVLLLAVMVVAVVTFAGKGFLGV